MTEDLAVRVQRVLPELIQRVDWHAERLREHRAFALRRLLRVAAERSPWHARRLRGVPVDRVDPSDVRQLPVMTKADLMDNFDAIVTDDRIDRVVCETCLETAPGDPLFDEFYVVASGGSSGLRGVFVYRRDEWITCYGSNVRFGLRDWNSDLSLRGVPRVIAVVAASSPTHISAALSKTFPSGANARHLFPVSLPLGAIVDGLNALQPTVLMGYSSFLPRLALEARSGRLRIHPRRVIAISEPLLPEAKALLGSVWQAPLANGYAMSEGLFTGSCGSGIHLPDDLCLVEPIDEHGDPSPPGTLSDRVLITNLYNHTQPLIRYEVTDQVVPDDTPCPCGSAFRTIDDPQGRLDDIFVLEGGVVVHPHVFRSALAGYTSIIEYQVRQAPGGVEISIVTTAPVPTTQLRVDLERALSELGVHAPEVAVDITDAVPRQASGKLKRFVPLSP